MGACKWIDHTTQLNCLLLRGQPKTASEAESGEDGYLTRTHTRLREKKGIDSKVGTFRRSNRGRAFAILNAHCWPISPTFVLLLCWKYFGLDQLLLSSSSIRNILGPYSVKTTTFIYFGSAKFCGPSILLPVLPAMCVDIEIKCFYSMIQWYICFRN